jgi:hypothetical protein
MRRFIVLLSIFGAALFLFNLLPAMGIGGNPIPTRTPVPTPTFAPTWTPIYTLTIGAQGEPTIVATEITEPTYVLMSARSGNILDDPDDGQIGIAHAPISVANFIVAATFHNPTSTGIWNYGFTFRNHEGGNYRLTIDSTGQWAFSYRIDNQIISSEEGFISNFDSSESGSNELELVVNGEEARFYVNGEEVGVFDVSANTLMGNIAVITTVPGTDETLTITSYENFTVWSIGLVPTFTPTALPETGLVAQIGRNFGEIQLGGGQLWTYEGQAGEILNIQVFADSPFNGINGVDLAGLDTFLIVRSPSGDVLVTSDDVETYDTNSGAQNLVLPEDGTYEFEIRSFEDSSVGTYTLVIDSSLDNFATPTPTQIP